MALCATDAGRAKARGKCPPKKVALEFRHADKGVKLRKMPRGSRVWTHKEVVRGYRSLG